ncbi:MAG TPA: ABC transporter permease [Acidimicrobiales bacterium]|nr:ABC transporter permease [Acidimicrobiales bacterium]
MVAEDEFEDPESVASATLAPILDASGRGDLPARIVSARVRLRPRLREIWKSRELVVFLIRKELKVKYKGSFLGFIWSMINPAIVLMVYYVVFRYFLRTAVPEFALYLFSGLLVWNFFGVTLGGASSAIVRNAGIVKKVSFPREILAISQVGTSLVFFFFQFLVLVLFLIGFRYAPAWGYLPLLLGALLDLVIFTTALSIFLSAANVYLRDVQHLIDVILQAWFWGVPIIYSYNRVYHHAHWLGYLFLADPITPIVLSFQRALYGHVAPLGYGYANGASGPVLANYPYHFYVAMLGWVFLASVVLLLASLLVFGRLEGNFAEEL